MRNFYLLLSFIFLFGPSLSQNKIIKEWDIFEISFTSSGSMENPYMEELRENEEPFLTASFNGISGDASGKSYQLPGFWDGDNNWKIRFAAPFSGTWEYVTQSKDRKLNGKKGKLTVEKWTEKELKENPTRRGLIIVNADDKRKGRYFTYSDGSPFLWVGDTWWNWTKEEIRFESFRELADTRSGQGFTVGQLFFAGNGWSEESSLLNNTYTLPDVAHIRKIEKMIRYANQKGITVWIHPWWSRDNIDETIGAEKMRRWWRYVVHRLHAYNVIWVLAGEYNMHDYGGLGLAFWNGLGKLVKSEDPYHRVTSTHPTPPAWGGGADAPQWSTAEVIHTQNWLDYNQSQPGHGRWRNEMIPDIVKYAYDQDPAKPIVVTEPWYEFIEGNPRGMDIRFGAWSAFLNGAAGHSYAGGHIWRAHLPESPSGVGAWPMDTLFEVNTYIYEGAQSMGFLSRFLQDMDWWKLEPHPELVIENPSRYCGANPGNEYLVYLRYGGTVKIDLSHTGKKMMQYTWIDLTDQNIKKQGDIKGGDITTFSPPEDYPGALHYKDWLLYIFAK